MPEISGLFVEKLNWKGEQIFSYVWKRHTKIMLRWCSLKQSYWMAWNITWWSWYKKKKTCMANVTCGMCCRVYPWLHLLAHTAHMPCIILVLLSAFHVIQMKSCSSFAAWISFYSGESLKCLARVTVIVCLCDKNLIQSHNRRKSFSLGWAVRSILLTW